MGRELTKRHSTLFKRKVGNPFSFVQDIYRYGKFRELVSFIIWELFHRLKLYPEEKYLKFSGPEALALDGQTLNGLEFAQTLERFFASQGLNITRTAHTWKLLFIKNGQIVGAQYPDDTDLYKSTDGGQNVVFLKRFPERIKSVFISSQNAIFVCVKGAVYRSSDGGETFEKTLELGSSESYFRHNNGMTEIPDGTLLIGEYGNVWEGKSWRKLAYLYISSDGGESWDRSDFLIDRGINKHVHLVTYSSSFDRVFMADGDNYKKLWVSEASDGPSLKESPPPWKPINRFHIQMGGYTSTVEGGGKLLFGTDYQGGTNFIVETTDGRSFTSRVVPDPYRRSPINNMVQRKSEQGREIWASLPYSTANTKCLLMYTADGGKRWTKVLEYKKGVHNLTLISSSNGIADELYFNIKDLKSGEIAVYRVTE